MAALEHASSLCVPRIPKGSLKPYWNDKLNTLKQKSIDIHNLWRTCGSPRSGAINSERLKVKLEYKQTVKNTS